MRTRLGALAAAAALTTSVLTGSASADPTAVPSPGSRADANGQESMASQAEAALAQVVAIFGDTPAGSGELPVPPRATAGTSNPDATMALRQLALTKNALPRSQRVLAERILARPDEGQKLYGVAYETKAKRSCSADVCVHYVRSTSDRVPLKDTKPANNIPDYVDLAKATLQGIHTTYRDAGYRSPKRDGQSSNDGGDARPDVYLADMPDGLYGFCSTDDPHLEFGSAYPYFDVSAYCVLDNNYAEFLRTPAQNLQITASHEYFHAVQFGYDVTEDTWLMEGTATWAEDELFDDVNDNRGYLTKSPIAQPSVPLDDSSGLRVYGTWAYFRYLSETFATPELGGLPTIIRDIWRIADASKAGFADGQETFSADAVRDALGARGVSFPTSFSQFGANNREPSLNYEEGDSWPTAPLTTTRTLTPTSTSKTVSRQLSHLTNATARFTPSGLDEDGWQLRLAFNLPDRLRGSAAAVKVYDGPVIETTAVELDSSGGAIVDVAFSTGTTDYVEVTLTNASVRFRLGSCYLFKTTFSCGGALPRDDNLTYVVEADAIPPA